MDGYCLAPYILKCCTGFKQFDGLNFDGLAEKHQKRQNFVLYDIACTTMTLKCPQIQRDFFIIFHGGMPPDPLALTSYACWLCFTQYLEFMTTHHPKFSIHITLQLVGLTTEKLLSTALSINIVYKKHGNYCYCVYCWFCRLFHVISQSWSQLICSGQAKILDWITTYWCVMV